MLFFAITCTSPQPLPIALISSLFSSSTFLSISSALSLLWASLTFALLFNVALPSSPNRLHNSGFAFTSLLRSKSQSQSMILLQSHSRFLLQTLLNRVQNFEKAVELDCNWVEFDDLRYHVQASIKNPHLLLLSVSLPTPPAETTLFGGLPNGAIEAIKAAYGVLVQILDPPKDGFNLTLKLNLSKLPPKEEYRHALLIKIASIREVVLGAPLRAILKDLGLKAFVNDGNKVVALVHRRRESFFLIPQAEKVTVIFPMRFKDTIDIALAKAFLQEFVEARRTASLNNAPLCSWTQSSPPELGERSKEDLSANAGFVSFVIFPRHVDGKKLDNVVWSLSTFHAYVSYHVKCSEGFMHTRMRRRVESLIQSLERAQTNPSS